MKNLPSPGAAGFHGRVENQNLQSKATTAHRGGIEERGSVSTEPWKKSLTNDEERILRQLIKLGATGCMKPRSVLNAEQNEVVLGLQRKGYVAMTKKDFMVTMQP